MSTRAMYVFNDESGAYNVYKHHDGYPAGGMHAILNALPHAWKGSRFEADDFAAAFVAGNKGTSGGGVYLMKSGDWEVVAPSDIEYRYEVMSHNGEVLVEIYEVHRLWHDSEGYGDWEQTMLLRTPLAPFVGFGFEELMAWDEVTFANAA